MTNKFTKTLAAGFIALAAPAQACDHTINISNWKVCATGPLGETSGEASACFGTA